MEKAARVTINNENWRKHLFDIKQARRMCSANGAVFDEVQQYIDVCEAASHNIIEASSACDVNNL